MKINMCHYLIVLAIQLQSKEFLQILVPILLQRFLLILMYFQTAFQIKQKNLSMEIILQILNLSIQYILKLVLL